MTGGFAVILHGFVPATKDIDLLIDASVENVQRMKRAMAYLPDNPIALIADDEVEKYQVVRIADEIVVDLLKAACGVDCARAADGGIEFRTVDGVPIPVGRKELLIETKQTFVPATPRMFSSCDCESPRNTTLPRRHDWEVSTAVRYSASTRSHRARPGP